MAILTGLGALLGGLSNTQAARTGKQSQTNSYSSTNTGTSTPTYTAPQTGLQGDLASTLTKKLAGGPDVTPYAVAGTDAINKTYKGIGDRLMQSLAARGFGNSGLTGTAALQTELGRAGAIGGLQGQLNEQALQQQNDTIEQALRAAYANPGTTSTSSTAGKSDGYGTSVMPGSVAAGSLSGGLTSLLSQLNQAMAYGG
jgi:hypothetical protein